MAAAKATITTTKTTTMSNNEQVIVDGRMVAHMTSTLNEQGMVSLNINIQEKDLFLANTADIEAAIITSIKDALSMVGGNVAISE